MNSISDDKLGYVYLAEQAVDDSVSKIGDVRIYDNHNVFFVDFDAVLHSFGVMNRNKRYYTAENVWSAIQTPKIQDLLKGNAWFGEQNHPTQETKDSPLTPERIRDVWMPNRSHKIMNPHLDGNLLKAHIQTASGTDAGTGMAKEIIQGMVPRFSCRSIATMKMVDGKPTVFVKFLITYDWVLYPSHQEAQIDGVVKPVLENGAITTDNPYTFEDVLLPLSEILDIVGNKDDNVKVLMESFDMSMDNIVGFDKTKTHAIIADRDNTIYAKISPRIKHEVDDFFASFK